MTTDEFFAEAKRLNLRVLGTPEETRAALDNKDSEIARLRSALERIARWHGEFPETGRYWDEPANTRPLTYGAAHGSSGERDYMRRVAMDALGAQQRDKT
jgi:hypothetical protein